MPQRVYGLKRNGMWLKAVLALGVKPTEQTSFTSNLSKAWKCSSVAEARNKRLVMLNAYGFATSIAVINDAAT